MVIRRFIQGSIVLLALAGALLTAGAFLPHSPLISLSSGGAQASAAVGSPEETSFDSKMMVNPVTYTYVAGAALSDKGGNGHVYQLVLDGTAESALKAAAEALGVEGGVQRSSQWTPESQSYFVGTENGTGKSLNIWWGGTGSWYFNNFAPMAESPCKVTQQAEDGSEYCAEYVEQQPTPELLPNETKIASDALRIFNGTGLKVSRADLTIYKDEWSASASASLKVAGQETAITWNIGYDSKGNLAWAGGHSVRVVDRGLFETVSAKSAVSRLSDWRWYGSPAPSEYPVAEATTRDMAVTPQPPLDQPEQVSITIDAYKPLLLQVWDKNYGSWLVPGFALKGNENSLNFVVALIEGVIELPEPMDLQPLIDPLVEQPETK